MPPTQNFSARQGSVVWGLNVFRAFLLTKFIEDLDVLEVHGLTHDQCVLVQQCIQGIIDEFDRVPEIGFEKTIVREKLVKFLAVYKNWNDHHGTDPIARNNRRAELKRLRHKRRKISEALAKRQLAISSELDKKFFMDLWKSLERIPNQYPTEFKRLSLAIKRSKTIVQRVGGISA